MTEVIFDGVFKKQAARLEPRLRKKLAALIAVISEDLYDSRLHTKRLSAPLSGTLSFRITRDWRVTFRFLSQTTVHLLEIKHRKDIYR